MKTFGFPDRRAVVARGLYTALVRHTLSYTHYPGFGKTIANTPHNNMCVCAIVMINPPHSRTTSDNIRTKQNRSKHGQHKLKPGTDVCNTLWIQGRVPHNNRIIISA